MTLAGEFGQDSASRALSPGLRRPRLGAVLALMLGGLFLPVLALEATLRIFGPVLPGNYSTGYYLTTDPLYGRFHVRGFSGWIRAPEYTTYFRTNQLGLRGPEVAQSKPADLFRVLVIGDSLVEAAQVQESQTFTQLLERSLTESGLVRRAEVLNAGIGGWGTGQETLYLREEGLRLQPDLVLLVLYAGNDIANNSVRIERQDQLETPYKPYWELDGADGLRQVAFKEREPDAPDSWLWLGRRASAAFNFVETGLVDKFKYRDLDVVGNERDVGKPVFLSQYPPEWEDSWLVTERLLAMAAADSAAAGSRLVTILAPSTFQVVPDDWRDLVRSSRRPATDWDQDKPSKKMAEIAQRRGLQVIDLLPALRRARDDGAPAIYFDRDKHWTPGGHEIVAREVEAQLRSFGGLTAPAR